jgi:glycosyltransferase involved in cell wall biosynthesis
MTIENDRTKKMKPLLSITIPTFNSEKTIAYCLSSIFDQGYSNKEVIIIDNNSSDKTEEISKKYNCIFLKLTSTKAQARKMGYDHSHGDFILFLDSDMYLEGGILEDLSNSMKYCSLDAMAIREEFPPNSVFHIAKNIEKKCYTDDFDIQSPRFYRKEVLGNVKWDRIDDGWDEYEIFLEANTANLKIGTCQKKIHLMGDPINFARFVDLGRYKRLYKEKYSGKKVITRQMSFRHRFKLLLPTFKTSYPYGFLVFAIKFSETFCMYVGSLLSWFFPPRR